MQTEIERTAYHEAGHAIACIQLGIRFKHVTIVPEEEKSLGCVLLSNFELHSDYDDSDKTRVKAEKYIICCLAGPIAENKFTKQKNDIGAYHDYQQSSDVAGNLFGPIKVQNKFMDFMCIQTESIFTYLMRGNANTDAWLKVKYLAQNLVKSKTLSYHDVLKLSENRV